jgi:solute:Na+ symporter, SSS family
MNGLFLLLFFGLGVIYLILGIIVSRGIKTNEDYFLAGRRVGFWPLTFTLVATQIGGGMLLGTAAESYSVGYYGLFYTLGMCLGFLILGLGFAAKLRIFNVSTTAELFEIKYGSIKLKRVASFLSALSLCGILAGQVVALKSLLWGLGYTSDLVVIGFWLFIVTYTVIGGLKAVVATDTFQVIFLIIVFVAIFVYSLLCEPGNFFSFKNMVARQDFFSAGRLTFLNVLPVLLNPMLFSLIEQDLGQRFFSAKTKKVAAMAAIASSIILLVFSFVPVYFGMKAGLSGIKIAVGASPLIPLISEMANKFVLALVVCGLSAAITSTSDSLLCAISSNIAQDFDFKFLKGQRKVSISMGITFIIGMAALGVGFFAQNIINTLVQSYELLISCIFIPVLLVFFRKNFNKNAAALSMLFGALGFILFKFYTIAIPSVIPTLLFSLVGYFIGGCLVDKRMENR